MPAVAGRQTAEHRDHDDRSGPASGRASRPSEPPAGSVVGRIAACASCGPSFDPERGGSADAAPSPNAAVGQRRAAACASGATLTAFERMQAIFPAS